MVLKKTMLPVVLVAGLALAVPGGSVTASPVPPVAHSAGGDAAPLNPAIVGVPMMRTEKALNKATDAVDAGIGAQAVWPLTASRRNLLRSYVGAKYLIAHPPAPEAEEARASASHFVRLARRSIRASRSGKALWLRAQASQDAVGPVIADTPTAVFNVLISQYQAVTTTVGMLPDVTGSLLTRVKTALNTAIVLRNRLVKTIHAAAPPAGAEEARVQAHASQEGEEAVTFDAVMPGLIVLLDDEQQQMQAMSEDASVPAASKLVLTNALAADKQIEANVNLWWPPVTAD